MDIRDPQDILLVLNALACSAQSDFTTQEEIERIERLTGYGRQALADAKTLNADGDATWRP